MEQQQKLCIARPLLQAILSPTDYSAASDSGFGYALARARHLSARVVLLHVVESPPRLAGMETVVLAREDSELVALARARLKQLAQRAGEADLPRTTCVRTGKPLPEITATASEQASI